MSAKHHPLSPDRRLHTEDLAVAHHVLIFVRDHGSRQCCHLRGNDLMFSIICSHRIFSFYRHQDGYVFASVCLCWLVGLSVSRITCLLTYLYPSVYLWCSSVVVQGHCRTVQLPTVGDVLLDAGRRPLSSHHHRLCVQRSTTPTLVLRHRRMG